MTDALREKYADALIAMLTREGPLSDLVPLLERLDALTGLELGQKALAAPVIETPTPSIEGRPPVEHGSGEATNPLFEDAEPDPLPVVEEAQQAPVSASAGPGPTAGYSAPAATPAAPSPKHACPDCGIKVSEAGRRCRKCANKIVWTPERRAEQSQRIAQRRASGREHFVPRSAPVESPEIVTPTVTVVTPSVTEEPARGLAAVIDNPPVEAPPSKFVCTCLTEFRATKPGFMKDIPNEGHHERCALYRKGGHRWPMPPQDSAGSAPFTITCGWCGESREVDRMGVPWGMAEANPAVSITSPYSKNAKAPA